MRKNLLGVAALLLVAACSSSEPTTQPMPVDTGAQTGGPSMVAPLAGQKTVEWARALPGDASALNQIGDRVLFGYDSSEISYEGQETLKLQAAWMNAHPSMTFSIEGHCDERGTREYNLALGERRAQATKNYLNALGVGSERLTTISYGKERPVDNNTGEAAWSQNRRGVTVIN